MSSKQEFYRESAKLCLQVVTPINVCDGNKLLPNDYLYDAKKQIVYFVNHRLWHRFIIEKNLLAQYESYLVSGNKTKNMLTWLEQQGYDLEDIKDVVCGSAKAEVNVLRTDSKQNVNEINGQTKLTDGNAYIPGSSLKGVFRTAIVYHLLQQDKSVKQKYWRQVLNVLQQYVESDKQNYQKIFLKRELNKLADDIEVELLHGLRVYDNGRPKDKYNAVNSVLRGLLVSDAVIDKAMPTVILQKCDLTFDRLGHAKQNTISVFRECLIPDTSFSFTVKLEKEITKCIGLISVEMLLQWVTDYFDFVMDFQREAFGKTYSKLFDGIEQANVFVGSNTGFLSKTILLALAPEGEIKLAMTIVKQLLDIGFRKHKHMTLDKFISPRTLKTTTYAGQQVLMGLARIKIK
ncbi:type III-A CRISPR-associated RAMP protein Csm5 [uncultured Phascolarctobacterium sp.]|uniref:type III-A CRISPR-associated RAMP protein Csm5 n=1 Tax=uncultured Phascolarctobacterium sp. TaxID=512296 RepID=UPI0025E90FCF|nr:type III-A CRISPR-associated RAMP protein Csm5 [uncultured Phascolarctobacterium sp.]